MNDVRRQSGMGRLSQYRRDPQFAPETDESYSLLVRCGETPVTDAHIEVARNRG